MNILDYLAWRGDLTFDERPFNEVDNLILSTLAYTNLDSVALPETVTLPQMAALYEDSGTDQSYLANDPKPLLVGCAASRRFRNVEMMYYVNQIDTAEQIQFSAMTFCLPDGSHFIAFRGTDNTTVGWREDFNLSYLAHTPGQQRAAEYVNFVAERTRGKLLVGGHSKGGNFAVYGAAFSANDAKARIDTVYSNDGPGFHTELAASGEYQSVVDRVVKIIPEDSLIGVLLDTKEDFCIIHADAKGFHQHSPYTWCVERDRFVPAQRAQSSLFYDEAMSRWMDTLSVSERENLSAAIFDAMEEAGIDSLHALSQQKAAGIWGILKAVREAEPGKYRIFMGTLGKLVSAGFSTATGKE